MADEALTMQEAESHGLKRKFIDNGDGTFSEQVVLLGGSGGGGDGGGGSEMIFAGYGPSVVEAEAGTQVKETLSDPFNVPALSPGDLVIARFAFAAILPDNEDAFSAVDLEDTTSGLALLGASTFTEDVNKVLILNRVFRVLVTDTGIVGDHVTHISETSPAIGGSRVSPVSAPTSEFAEPREWKVVATASSSQGSPGGTQTHVYAVTLEVVPAGGVALINPGAA